MAKYKPQRTCVVCREVRDKRDLIRVVRTPGGTVQVDPSGKANGRGAYLCRQGGCWEKIKTERLGQTLKVTLSSEEMTQLYVSLQTELSKA